MNRSTADSAFDAIDWTQVDNDAPAKASGALDEIDTTNDHLVGIHNGKVSMMILPIAPMTVAAAIRLAAWIVCIADAIEPSAEKRFNQILEAVRNT